MSFFWFKLMNLNVLLYDSAETAWYSLVKILICFLASNICLIKLIQSYLMRIVLKLYNVLRQHQQKIIDSRIWSKFQSAQIQFFSVFPLAKIETLWKLLMFKWCRVIFFKKDPQILHGAPSPDVAQCCLGDPNSGCFLKLTHASNYHSKGIERNMLLERNPLDSRKSPSAGVIYQM